MPNKYTDASDTTLLNELRRLSVSSQKANVILAALVDDDFFEALHEARRRCVGHQADVHLAVQESMPKTQTGRLRNAHSVELEPARFKALLYGRRISLSEAGRLIGMSDGWGSAVCCKRRTSLESLERLSHELDIRLDDFIAAVGSEVERTRVGLLR